MFPHKTSIRFKLTVATLVPLATAIALSWVIGASIITRQIFSQAQQTVESDLNSAHEIFVGEITHLTDIILRLTSLTPELISALDTSAGEPGIPSLQSVLGNERLSFLTVVDRKGIVRYRAMNPQLTGDSQINNDLVAEAFRGVMVSGAAQLSMEQATRENPQLATALPVKIIPTPDARNIERKPERRGMFLVASAPARNSSGEVIGAVYGGILLNNESGLVDRITQVIFQHADTSSRSSGNATLFLEDVCIATSSLDSQGWRTTGRLMPSETFGAINSGRNWSGRTFVQNEWQLSAYKPLRDYRNNVIGALYVGMPERPYHKIRSHINIIFSGVLVFVTLIGIGLSAWLSRRLSKPVKALQEGVRRITAGEDLPDISVESPDEIAELAHEFNIMKHRLAAREEENLTLNRTLEDKVLERTSQLTEKSQELLNAQMELAQAERLAAIGMLASGVAHEINNPLAIIRGNAELLQLTPQQGDSDQEEVFTIIRQVGRIERIVRSLLSFSSGGLKQVSRFPLEELLDSILDQIGHQIPLHPYRINRDYSWKDVYIEGDEYQLRQVFTNLILNGLQSMDQGGSLTVDVQTLEEGRAEISVTDTGSGIRPELTGKLFTPFFTTKAGGTGLGLAVSYGIVKDHGGEIRVVSETGCGSTFTVSLPLSFAPLAPRKGDGE